MLVYLAMAVELPPWALRAIDKIRRNFLWRGRKDAKSGHCLLAWPKVCRPVEIIGLGISNLQNLNSALRMRWIWLQKTWLTTLVCIRNSSSWLCLGLIFHGRLAVVSEVRNVTSTLFWTDRWLHGQCIADLAPQLFSLVTKRRAYKRTVQEAHMNYC